MSFVTIVYTILFYVAAGILVIGLVNKIVQFASTPAPFKIPTMPAPLTRHGAVWRVMREVILFESLFRSDKWLWLFSALFHISLLLIILRHARYFLSPACGMVWEVIILIQPFGTYAAFAMLVGLLALLARRVIIARVRYISGPSDILMLALLFSIALSGTLMTFGVHTDIISLKRFFVGLLMFSPQLLPIDVFLLVHLFCVVILMIVFPFSKLLHFPGIFFSPTRNQCDNARERRHLAVWAVGLEVRQGGNGSHY